MRLHHLRLEAFGPFAGVEEVDFDELCDAGLFLLTGPTGAGKTTVLDAVCFALYGSVPGVRGVKALRSQHADEDARPEVVLDFSVRERRFTVRRTPEWSRPKRRGTGFTTENASATLVETTSGEEHLLSSRAQEVGHFIGELVGMQATQFVQVAMLPQGEFQKFLRASSQDRHDVLQHLFRTDRFSRIEDWVHEHSRALKDRSADGESGVLRVLDTLAERAAAELPEDPFADPVGWAEGLAETAGAAHVAARDQHEAASSVAATARSRQQDAQRLAALRERRDQAAAALAELELDEAGADQARTHLDSDTRAGRCLPLLEMLDPAVVERDRRAEAWAGAASSLDRQDLAGYQLPETRSAESLQDLEERVRAATTRLEALLPREQDLHQAREELSSSETELAATSREHEAARLRAAAIPEVLDRARQEVGDLTAEARKVEALVLQHRRGKEQLDAATEAESCAASLELAREHERDARDRAADARDRVQDLTARRLAGIAAELAGRLADGLPCQVCGSTEHPHPAEVGEDAVTEGEQAEAATAYEAATASHADARGAVLQTEERLARLRAAADQLSPAEASAAVEEIDQRLRRARDAEQALEQAEQSVAALTQEQQELTTGIHDLATRIATLEQSIATRGQSIATLEAEIAGALDIAGDGSRSRTVREEVERHQRLAASLREARDRLAKLEAARTRVGELETHVHDSAVELGFADATELRAAVLGADERSRLEQLLRARAQAETRARAVLEEEDVRALEDTDAPDLEALAAAVASAEVSERETARNLHQREEVVAAVGRLRGRLEEALSGWRPLHEEYARAEAMSKLVRGMGSDNQLQMRLSAYVLATRLDQVVAAANERLAHMRDQRYLLQRTGRAARKGSQAGLGLEVVDQWTGDVRDPTTLSGGETFVVSLALALGLADVVTHEAGGTEIETLFVDEGFGTLDADTLDDVMDRLDDLRAGGRAVGVVSHVSELRNRIPTQLHVEKHRNGSTVAVRTTVG